MDSLRESEKVCLFDANILIDLYKGDIFPFLAEFPYHCLATDFVLSQSRNFSIEYAHSCGIQSHSLDGSLVSEIYRIRNNLECKKKDSSIADISCYVLAVHENFCLVTGDSTLRKHAERKGVEVHGVLWVLDEMVKSSVLTTDIAYNALSMIRDNGAYLPKNEIEKRLMNWKLSGLDEDGY